VVVKLDLDLGRRIILKYILKRWGDRMWRGLIWLRIETSGWLV
jgi:hypothetical protein